MEHTSVSSLVVVIIVAFFTPILLHRFKLTIKLCNVSHECLTKEDQMHDESGH